MVSYVNMDTDLLFRSGLSLLRHQLLGCLHQVQHFINASYLLTCSTSVHVTRTLASRQLDHFNSLFRSLSKFNLHKLQCIQNSVATVV